MDNLKNIGLRGTVRIITGDPPTLHAKKAMPDYT